MFDEHRTISLVLRAYKEVWKNHDLLMDSAFNAESLARTEPPYI